MSTASTEVTTTDQPRSVQMVRMGGHEYPQVMAKNCKVCHSPARQEIEEAINLGSTYAKIERTVCSGEDPKVPHIAAQTISEHFKRGHMNPSVDVMRVIAEQRAERMGRSVEVGEQSLIDSVAYAQVVEQKAWEGIANGTLQVTVRDGIAAAKLLSDLGLNDPGLDRAAYVEAYNVFHAEAKMVMGEELFEEFLRRLDANPVLQELSAKFEEAAPAEVGQ